MRLLFILLLYLAASLAQEQPQRGEPGYFSIYESVCCCENATQPCCPINVFDFNTDQFITTGSDPDYLFSIEYGNFSNVWADYDFGKTNYNLLANQPIDCSAIRSFLFDSTGLQIVPFADIRLENASPTSCLANFSKRISQFNLSQELDLVIAIANATGYQDIQLNLLQRDPIIGFSLPLHAWVVEVLTQNSVVLDLNIDIGTHSAHNDTCFDDVSNTALQFISDQQDCLLPATTLQRSGPDVVRIFTELQQTDYLRCYASSTLTSTQIRYQYAVYPIIQGCEYPNDLFLYPPFMFTISMNNRVDASTDTNVNSVQISYLELETKLIPCAQNGTNPLIPTAKLQITLEITSAYDTIPILFDFLKFSFQDVFLEVISGPVYFSVDPINDDFNSRVRYTLQTTDCLFVDTIHSSTPNTLENFIGCKLTYLPLLDFSVRLTYADQLSEVAVLTGNDRRIRFETLNISKCPVTPLVTDVQNDFDAELLIYSAEDLANRRPVSVNLNSPIVIEITLIRDDDTTPVESSAVSVVMDSVVVSLDDEFVRTYTVADKVTSMQVDFHPFYTDGHYCKKFDEDSGLCLPFYEKRRPDTSLYWNPYLTDNAASLFVEDLSPSAYERFKYCSNQNNFVLDRFIFTPSNWVFSAFERNLGTLRVTATAYLRVCTYGNESDANVTVSRRQLQLQNREQTTILINEIMLTNPITIDVDESIDVPRTVDLALVLGIVFGSIGAVVLVLAVIMYGSAACFKIRRSTEKVEDLVQEWLGL